MSTPAEIYHRNREIEEALAEAKQLTSNPRATRRDLTRANVLLARVSALKSGFGIQEVLSQEANERAVEVGEEPTYFPKLRRSPDRLAEARAWVQFIREGKVEQRVGQLGSGPELLPLSTPGSFVPIQFLARTYAALKAHDPLFDPEVVTYVETERGRLLHVPYASDVGNVAQPVTESSQASYADLTSTGHAQSTPKAYRTPMWQISLEAMQDMPENLDGFISHMELAEYFFADRIARGVGYDLLKGSGTGGHIFGVIGQLLGAGVSPVIATGSSSTTGGSETGANSIGVPDLAKLFTSVNAAYRSSPKCFWLMNDSTLAFLLGLINKFGGPIVNLSEGLPSIFGKRVLISPSMDSIGGSKVPVLFGDFRYWLTHCAKQGAYVQRYWEAPGLVEKGIVGLRAFVRYDGNLLWNDAANSTSPIAMLQNAS